MNMTEYRIEFIKALGVLAVTIGEEISEERILAYFEVFKKRDPTAVLSALELCMTNCESFPKPAKIVELMTGGKGGGQDPTSAWQQVLKNLERHGVYTSVEFEDGAIAAAIEMLGGWADLGAMSYKDLTLQRIQDRFESLYREAVRQGRHRQPGRVAGLHDIQNGANYPHLEPSKTQKALTGEQIMNQAAARRPAGKQLEAPRETFEIPAGVYEAGEKLASKIRLQ